MRMFLILSLAVAVSSCVVNPATKFYRGASFEDTKKQIVPLKQNEEVIIIPVLNEQISDSVYKFRSSNYHLFGQSAYSQLIRDPKILKQNLETQAKQLKATHVIYSIGGTVTSSGRTSIQATYWAKSINKPKIGISPTDISPKIAKEIERNTGVVLAIIYEGTPAFNANLLKDDILIKVNDSPIINTKQLTEVINELKSEDILLFTILRNKKEKLIEIDLK